MADISNDSAGWDKTRLEPENLLTPTGPTGLIQTYLNQAGGGDFSNPLAASQHPAAL
jgi:hypothetical protein